MKTAGNTVNPVPFVGLLSDVAASSSLAGVHRTNQHGPKSEFQAEKSAAPSFVNISGPQSSNTLNGCLTNPVGVPI